MEFVVFLIAGAIVVGGAIGVLAFANPVHSALSLVATLFGVAVLFVAQEAQFLAAVQVIVYAGAIVVLFLFVIMLLGVDRSDDLRVEPIVAQRPLAVLSGVGVLAASLVAVLSAGGSTATSTVRAGAVPIPTEESDAASLGRLLFTDHVLAFEITAILLTVAVVGAVVLARRPGRDESPVDTDVEAEA